MRYTIFLLTSCICALQGCVPTTAVVHDGLKTKVIDSMTKEPLSGAFVFDHLENGRPHTLVFSNERGEVLLNPKRRFMLSSLLGEALIFQSLWVCKEGYVPYLAGSRGGWNADYGPSRLHTPTVIELTKSPLSPAESCLAI
jgi:hypothetical protein